MIKITSEGSVEPLDNPYSIKELSMQNGNTLVVLKNRKDLHRVFDALVFELSGRKGFLAYSKTSEWIFLESRKWIFKTSEDHHDLLGLSVNQSFVHADIDYVSFCACVRSTRKKEVE